MPMANVNGININYRVEGQGEPLIMISGLAQIRVTGGIKQEYSRNITAQSHLITEVWGSLTNQLDLTPSK